MQKFVHHVTQLLEDVWDEEVDGQTQWSVIRHCTLQACNEMLGRGGSKQPDWFVAAESSFQPIISKCNKLFSRWLWSGRNVDRQRYLCRRHCVVSAVRSNKNKWLQEKAQSIQDALAQGRSSVVWKDIHAIHECWAGLQPVWCCAVKKRDGELCVGFEETLCRWREYFEGVLNVMNCT